MVDEYVAAPIARWVLFWCCDLSTLDWLFLSLDPVPLRCQHYRGY